MGMPITVTIEHFEYAEEASDKAFDYFQYVDEKFSTYKSTSEITAINEGRVKEADYSEDMKTVFRLSEETKKETGGYFDIIGRDGRYDPSGLVKGWAVYNVSEILRKEGCKIFFIDAGGDIQANGKYWKVGIKNPFNEKEIIKVLYVKDRGVATSGTYIRGQHIYNPHDKKSNITEIVSITVIGPNIYEADRFATAAFAMGKKGVEFIENLKGFEGYMIDKDGKATMTSGFELYTINPEG